ncbi:MAG: hypothetical protein OEV43_05225, partial [Coriobacteriia bacterium]|nr:hypothetical protein [Coriobacteriia bacterium]
MDATRVEKARSLGRLVLGVGIPIAVLAVGFLLTRSLADWQYESLVGLATAETDVQALTDVQDGMAGTFVLLFVYGIAMFVSTAVAMTLARSRLLGV